MDNETSQIGAGDATGKADANAGAETKTAPAAQTETQVTSDAGKPDAAKAQAEDWAKDVPAQFRGKDQQETITRLLAAQGEYREHLSRHGKPVKDVAEYEFKPNEATAPYLGEKGDIELANKALAVMADAGIGKLQGSKLLNGLMEMMIGLEVMDPPVDVATERGALLPQDARALSKTEQEAAIDRRILKAQAFVKSLQAEGLEEASATPLVAALSTAAGVQLVEFLAGRMGAVNPISGASLGAPMGEVDLQKLVAATARDDLEGQKRISELTRKMYGGQR